MTKSSLKNAITKEEDKTKITYSIEKLTEKKQERLFLQMILDKNKKTTELKTWKNFEKLNFIKMH